MIFYKFNLLIFFFFFFFNDTATTEIYTLSLHDALPISRDGARHRWAHRGEPVHDVELPAPNRCADRKSTRLNSSHLVISYAVFCLKKKKKIKSTQIAKYRHMKSVHDASDEQHHITIYIC